MSEKISLKEAERKAFRATFLDGLNDILWGLMILSLVLSAILRENIQPLLNYLPVLVVIVIGIPLFFAAKKWLVIPRIGLVKFTPRRTRKLSNVRWFLIGLFVITLVVFLLPYLNPGAPVSINGPYWLVDAFFGLLIIALFSFMAFSLDQPRMHLYGFLLGLSLPFDVVFEEVTGLDWALGLFVAGAVMLGTGIIIFARFLNDHPIPEGDVYDGVNG